MPDISTTLLTEIKLALDDALRLLNPVETDDDFNPSKAVGGIIKVRAKVEQLIQNSSDISANCVNIHAELDKAIRLVNGLQTQLSKISRASLKKAA
jgi:hypothetical protein